MGELTLGETQGGNDIPDSTPKELLSRFYSLQEERVQTYHMFEEGFQAYLRGAPNYNFPLYRQLVHEVTETFRKISQDIVSIKLKFAEHNNLVAISVIIDHIQTAEKTKLELTAKFQLCRQKHQDEPSETTSSENEELKQSLKENRDYIVEQMEELKYESEDIYSAESEPDNSDSTLGADNSSTSVER